MFFSWTIMHLSTSAAYSRCPLVGQLQELCSLVCLAPLDFLQTRCGTWQLYVRCGQLYDPQMVPEKGDDGRLRVVGAQEMIIERYNTRNASKFPNVFPNVKLNELIEWIANNAAEPPEYRFLVVSIEMNNRNDAATGRLANRKSCGRAKVREAIHDTATSRCILRPVQTWVLSGWQTAM